MAFVEWDPSERGVVGDPVASITSEGRISLNACAMTRFWPGWPAGMVRARLAFDAEARLIGLTPTVEEARSVLVRAKDKRGEVRALGFLRHFKIADGSRGTYPVRWQDGRVVIDLNPSTEQQVYDRGSAVDASPEPPPGTKIVSVASARAAVIEGDLDGVVEALDRAIEADLDSNAAAATTGPEEPAAELPPAARESDVEARVEAQLDAIDFLPPDSPPTSDPAGEVELGAIYFGTVVRVIQFGAFVEILPGHDGLLHALEIVDAAKHASKRDEVIKVGARIKVRVIGKDTQGRIHVTMRGLDVPFDPPTIEGLRRLEDRANVSLPAETAVPSDPAPATAARARTVREILDEALERLPKTFSRRALIDMAIEIDPTLHRPSVEAQVTIEVRKKRLAVIFEGRPGSPAVYARAANADQVRAEIAASRFGREPMPPSPPDSAGEPEAEADAAATAEPAAPAAEPQPLPTGEAVWSDNRFRRAARQGAASKRTGTTFYIMQRGGCFVASTFGLPAAQVVAKFWHSHSGWRAHLGAEAPGVMAVREIDPEWLYGK